MALSNPSVSMIMLTYNHEKYISESIESVLNQTFRDFELIIINDGSIDRTDEIVKTFKDDRIKYIYQENQGVSAATNQGILVAKGKYIALMSGDDVCYPQRLARQYQYLSEIDRKVVVFSWVDFINEDSQVFSGEPHIQENWFNRDNQSGAKIFRHFFERGNYVNAPTAFMEKSALVDSGLFNLSSIQAQDFHKWIELLGRGYEIFIIPEKLLKYRVNGNTLSQSQSSKDREGFEYEILVKDFFGHTSIKLFKEAFKDLVRNSSFSDGIEYELEKAFVYLNYTSPLFRKTGTEKLFNLLQDPAVLAVSKEKYGVNLPSLYKLMSNVFTTFDPVVSSQVLVSVVIPCYNHAAFLAEAVDSVVNQNYRNWECIIVNDGSPDNTNEIATYLIEKYQGYKISLVDKINGGLASARNAGIHRSNGRYILCLDADDQIGSEFIADSIAILKHRPEVGFVYTDVQYFGAKTETIGYGEFNLDRFLRNNQATATSLFRREIFDSVGGYKEIMDGGLEDWEFWISACESGWSGYHLAKACFYYRQHDRGSMLQDLVSNKAKIQTLFARIISLHSNLYTDREIEWSNQILTNGSIGSNSNLDRDSLLQACQHFLATPPNFDKLGAADRYYQDLQKWMNYLHQATLDSVERASVRDVVDNFARTANFIHAYFNSENLKDIYIQRAEIIELSLQQNECQIDYDFANRPPNRQKIRLGIIAAHFNPSSETFATLPVYEFLSRDFEVVLYSFQQTNHPLEQYCRSAANFFVTLPASLTEQVNIIRNDDLDILFFATNVTLVTNQICLLASHRLARIQITSGGSVATTGMRHMDYFISGTFTDPAPNAQEQYREKLIQLPGAAHCFSYGDYAEESSVNIDREQLGIAEDKIVFTSGANFYKIIPELIHTWAKILADVPNSIIILFPFGPNWSTDYPKQAFEQHLHQIFAEYGVSADRILALDPQPVPNREDLKEYFKLADIYLDSYPFAGTTSLIEPLQVNLPVIARQGNSFRSAMGSAMIRSLEIADLVADSEESYIQLAVNLGINPELRHQKRAEIQTKMQNNPSCLDSRGYSAKIGRLFTELVDRYAVDKLNKNLCLRDINLMVFPDWSQSEEAVGLELQQVIQTLAAQPDSQNTTLLIDTTNIDLEDAQMFISSIAMNLMMEADLDITEQLEISLIEDLSNIQWDSLLPKIEARIVLECDNRAAVAKLPHQNFAQRQLESFGLN
ncbi:glycosyltransferase [Chamaesiphon sp. OTE_75_metabat_556]|uniref:glycosyltransferase n=1 Tax=Chamaesiphon sp. OTE_75_metabat_556 TaxID=2964692 RepID=UPI002869EFFB|nr:glycosyltransferase [Chamaesiphon sp. OTE_75_metabat_556]